MKIYRRCAGCKSIKELHEFVRNDDRSDGYDDYCLDCGPETATVVYPNDSDRMDPLVRMLKMIRVLSDLQWHRIGRLSELFEVSPRTIRRHISAMERAGLPIEWPRDRSRAGGRVRLTAVAFTGEYLDR